MINLGVHDLNTFNLSETDYLSNSNLMAGLLNSPDRNIIKDNFKAIKEKVDRYEKLIPNISLFYKMLVLACETYFEEVSKTTIDMVKVVVALEKVATCKGALATILTVADKLWEDYTAQQRLAMLSTKKVVKKKAKPSKVSKKTTKISWKKQPRKR